MHQVRTHGKNTMKRRRSPTSRRACCSDTLTEVFYEELRHLPEPVFRRALDRVGGLAKAHPRMCHRKVFLMALFGFGMTEPIDGYRNLDESTRSESL